MIIFLRRFSLPVVLGAWICYVLTLSHGMTLNSLVFTSKVAGWDWLPMEGRPLSWLLTLPLRLLPAGWMPVGLNLFSALAAAVTLGILARSLELLPWPRPLDGLKGWQRQAPLALGIAVCGLEINFWQAATSATGEMVEVLALASAIWCLLEFRAGKNLRWLYAAAAVWGLGMAENWMMWLTLPLFLAGFVWLRKLRFFQVGFILRIAGCLLAGFSIYAVLPLANGLLPRSPWTLGEAWFVSLKQTQALLLWFFSEFWPHHRAISLVAVIYYLLPMLAFLPVPDEKVGSVSTLSRMDVWILRGQRAGLLLLCVFLTLNPIVGLRHILAHEMNLSLPLLSLDYLNGLAAGFLAGKLILLHGEDFTRRRRTGWRLELQVSRAVFPVLTVLCSAIILTLIVRNVPVVTQANRNSLAQFGELAWRSLPPEGGFLLSDFPEKLMVFQAVQARHTARPTWLPIDLKSLPTPEYRARLDRLRPELRLASTNRHSLTPPEMVYAVAQLLKHGRVFYLHPNSGFLGEVFYAQPEGSVYELKKYASDPVELPTTPPEAIARTEKTWDDFAPQLESLRRAGEGGSLLTPRFEKELLLEQISFNQIAVLEGWYSLALNAWGVDLQRNGSWPAAKRRFTDSLALSPENWVAGVNLTVNSNLLAGIKMEGAENRELAQKLGDVGSIQKLGVELNLFGPVDEPSLCLMLGNLYQQQQEPRMAFQQFNRAQTLAPGALAPKFALANLFLRYHLKDQALKAIKNLRAEISGGNVNPEWDLQASFLEAKLWLSQTNSLNARGILEGVADKYGKRPGILDRVAETYLEYNDMTNAESVMTGLLAAEPDDQAALLNQSRVFIMAGRGEAAIPILDHLLTLTNLPEARFNRAQAYMISQKFNAAKADYLDLLGQPVNQLWVNLNLGRIAIKDHDTNLAARYFLTGLSNAPAGSIEWQTASNQLHAVGVQGY